MSRPMVKLGDVASFVRGITFKPDDVIPVDSPDAVACMRTKNVQEQIDLADVWGIPRSFVRRPEQFVREGDLLVSTANSWNIVGKCCWVPALPWPATIGGFIAALRGSQYLDPRYLYHWFSSSDVQIRVRNCARQTTNIANLSFDRCLDLSLPLPALAEQKRISATLDQSDDLHRLSLEYAHRLTILRRSVFSEMFLGETSRSFAAAPLAEVVAENTIVTYGIVQAGDEHPGGVPYIRTGDIKHGAIVTSGLRHTSPEIASKFERSRVKAGEIVMSIRATVGTTAVVPPELDGANLTQGTARIAPGLRAKRSYLLDYLRSPTAQQWIEKQVKGATFREITLSRLRELPIPLPPMVEQEQFASFVQRWELEYAKAANAAHMHQALFTSLQHRALRGEL